MRRAPAARSRAPFLPLLSLLILLPAPLAGASPAASTAADPALRREIEAMKRSPRGPFARIRWFCADGTVHPPSPYPCGERGGGVQHGEWSAQTQALRADGYAVGNLIVALDPAAFVGDAADLATLRQVLLERFLIGTDDGWIFRGARTYRGAIQIEDEEAGARALIAAMLRDSDWLSAPRFFLLREAVRLLPRTADAVTAERVRQLAIDVAELDPRFEPLRAKIHNAPDAADAGRVRAHAEGRAVEGAPYQELATSIDALYAEQGTSDALRALAERSGDPWIAEPLRTLADRLAAAPDDLARLGVMAPALADLRERLLFASGTESRLAVIEASLLLEDGVYAAGNQLAADLDGESRRARLRRISLAAEALYGCGLFSFRHLEGVRESLARMESPDRLQVDAYRAEVRYLARGAEWADRWVAFHFGDAVTRWSDLEPKAILYPQFRLRGSPLFFYGAVVDSLVRDANRLTGIEHELFGERVGAGLRALNPGLARGVLHVRAGEDLATDGIYLLPETISELPPVAGILTRGEGSSLSHVQLLARNLGIPNVVVTESRIPALAPHAGRPVVLAVSHGGVVQLATDGSRWEAVFGGGDAQGAEGGRVVIRPDLEKLDLSVREPVSLDALRAADSGRISGPKGANLGELKHLFGNAVPPGFVIPFGVFRGLLDAPLEPGGPVVWDWMRARYAAIAALEGPARAQAESAFLERLRGWIAEVPWSARFEEDVRRALRRHFGEDGSYGVFVRSDTNVEDLPGFTGAGLNLTVPNVVGEDAILAAVRRVWASPFTERAYAWRQSHMEQPEYVFPAVVVQLGFPAEKSGVMVTADVDTGDADWLTVAVNEGVGGAVDGQAAESLRVHRESDAVRFLAQATAPRRALLSPEGGVVKLPATGADAVLEPAEIRRLREFAARVHARFPALADEEGKPVPADVEFAFRDGKLALLQLRPFVESKGARRNLYLQRLDADLDAHGRRLVRLDAVPSPADAPGSPAPAPPAVSGAPEAPLGAPEAPLGAPRAAP